MTSPRQPTTVQPDDAAAHRYLVQHIGTSVIEAAQSHGAVQSLAQERTALQDELERLHLELDQLRTELQVAQSELETARTTSAEDGATQAP